MRKDKITGKFKVTHGMSFSSEYRSWVSMKARCLNPDNDHENYRNVKICNRWVNSFENFLNDMGAKPTSKHTIERVRNDRGYYPSNCRWATRSEQNRNYSQNRKITYDGLTLCVTEWAEKLGIDRHRIYQRLNKGWPIGKALKYNRSL